MEKVHVSEKTSLRCHAGDVFAEHRMLRVLGPLVPSAALSRRAVLPAAMSAGVSARLCAKLFVADRDACAAERAWRGDELAALPVIVC